MNEAEKLIELVTDLGVMIKALNGQVASLICKAADIGQMMNVSLGDGGRPRRDGAKRDHLHIV